MKKRLIALLLAFVMCLSLCACAGKGGDGKSTCRNCGRKKPLVAGFGYCSTCYQGFNDFQKRNKNR